MNIKQLSVFLENKTGRINEVTKILAAQNIAIHAFSMAEANEFGILRLIVSDIEKAVQVLRDDSFAVKETEVVCVNCANAIGSLTKVLDHLTVKQIFIDYMYGCEVEGSTFAIIRAMDADKCMEALKDFK